MEELRNDIEKEKLWSLIKKVRRLSVRLIEAIISERFDHSDLERWSNTSEASAAAIRRFEDPASRQEMFAAFGQNNKDAAVRQFRKELHQKRRKIFIMRMGGAAAAVAVVGLAVWYFGYSSRVQYPVTPVAQIVPGSHQAVLVLGDGKEMQLNELTRLQEQDGTAITQDRQGEIVYQSRDKQQAKVDTNTLIIPRGGEYTVVLSDGTRVSLNSESELRYPTNFTGEQREVYLKGEAYLEVAKSDRPFIIRTYGTQVKVYGTTLDVNSYNPENVKVVLVEGKVGVSSEVHPQEVVLKPNQLAELSAGQKEIVVREINAAYYTAWQNGYFAFQNERLDEILTVLARWYDFEVLYVRPELKNIRFTASLKKEEAVEQILRQFEKTESIHFRVVGNQIIVQDK